MAQRIRIGNVYYHKTRQCEVIVTNRDGENNVWFRDVEARDNAGVISTSGWVEGEPYDEFLGNVDMRDYPDDWQQLRRAVLDRDDQTCQGCGAHVSDDVEHHVHHIVPLGCGGTNTLRNLITLCEECHGRIHGGPV